MSINALIMAGGEGSRLGMDKAFIHYYGEPQVLHLHKMLKSLVLEVYISCRRDQQEKFQNICPLVFDREPSIGPIGGVLAAMVTHTDHDWLVMACDMPMVSVQTLQNLLDHQGPERVITYKSEKKSFPEVLLTIYRKELLSTFQQAAESKSYSLQNVLKSVDTLFLSPDSEQELINVNTIEDLNRVNNLIKAE